MKGDPMALTAQQKVLILKFLASTAQRNNLVKEVTEKK
jgi:hypothetical protein